MAKKSKRFFLPADDYCRDVLPTDHEPTLAMMGIRINWKAYDAMVEKLCRQRKLEAQGQTDRPNCL